MVTKIKSLKNEIFFFITFLALRFHNLGYDIFNTDVWKWKSRIFNFGSGIFTFNFEQTVQRYHPGVTLMWLGTLGVKINSFYYKVLLGIAPPDNEVSTIFTLHIIQKWVIVFAIGLILASVFFVTKKLFSLKFAWILLFLLSVEPFYVALTRVIHLEGLLSTLMFASFIWYCHFLFFGRDNSFVDASELVNYSSKDYSKIKSVWISAVFAALAILTKTSALAILPIVGIVLFIHLYLDSQKILLSVKNSLRIYVHWLLKVVLFFVLFWPALWVNPSMVFDVLYSGVVDTGVTGGHGQLFFGTYVEDPGFIFYPVVFLYRSSIYLILGFISFFFICKKIENKRLIKFSYYAIVFALIYFIEMSIPSKKLDRYLLPSLVGLMIPASVSISYIFDLIAKRSSTLRSNISKKLGYLIFAPALFTFVYLTPDYLSYYNPLLGGLKSGIYVIEPKWIIGVKEIQSYVLHLQNSGQYQPFNEGESLDSLIGKDDIKQKLIIAMPEKYYTQIYPFILETGSWATIKDITAQAVVTDYFIYPVWEDDSYLEDRFDIEFVDTIKLRGVNVYNVYKRVD